MKDDIHNTKLIDKYSDTAVLCSLGELQSALNGSSEKKASIVISGTKDFDLETCLHN
jgi:hypothetical protein